MGQLLALKLLALSATAALDLEGAHGEFTIGTPLCTIAANMETPWRRLSAGVELDLAGDGAALRALASGHLHLIQEISLDLDVAIGRAIAFRGVDTWEADLGLDAEVPLDARTRARLGAHALGYLGPDAHQRGVVFLGRIGARVTLEAPLSLIVDLGWMASADDDRPYAAVGVGF